MPEQDIPRVYNKNKDDVPVGAVYVGRPSKWGNPFKIGDIAYGKVITREKSIQLYEDWFMYSDEGVALQKQLKELKGKSLVCWCSPLGCHADLLLKLANKENDNAK